MRAAIYARKSSKQERANEEALSTTRQQALAREFAARQTPSWDVVAVYVDEGVSGAEYVNRPEYQRMMNDAARSPRPWDVIIVMEQSRLGRDTGRVLVAIQALEDHGVEIWSYQTGQRITLGSESGDVNATVLALVDKIHRRQASQRTREALRQKARSGRVACGKVFGYDNVDGKRVVN